MIIIIGLGNPGAEYKNTRHNVGFVALDKFAEQNGFEVFSLNKKADALVSEKENVILVKPQTYMNESGKSAREITSKIKDQVSDVVVVHDDIDLEAGKIKIVKERGSAGHKGVESIVQNIGNDGLIRFRIGIAPLAQEKVQAKNIVLKNFSEDEQTLIDGAIQKTVGALNIFLKDGLEKAMNEYNK